MDGIKLFILLLPLLAAQQQQEDWEEMEKISTTDIALFNSTIVESIWLSGSAGFTFFGF